MRSGRPTRTHNLRLLVFFGIFVAVLVVFSLVLKFISLARESRFDGEHFFVVSFLHSADADIVGFDPKSKKITILHISGTERLNLQESLGIPIDGEVNGEITTANSISTVLFNVLIRYQEIKTNLTILDVGRLAFFAKTVSSSDITEESLSFTNGQARLPSTGTGGQAEGAVSAEGIVSELFIDPTIQEEKVTIEIINATGRSGLGQRLEQLLYHMGGNVIALTTSSKIMKTSSMTYFGDKTYTLSRIRLLLKIPLVYTEKSRLADITIFLGEDIVHTKRF